MIPAVVSTVKMDVRKPVEDALTVNLLNMDLIVLFNVEVTVMYVTVMQDALHVTMDTMAITVRTSVKKDVRMESVRKMESVSVSLDTRNIDVSAKIHVPFVLCPNSISSEI